MKKKVTKEEKAYLEERLVQLEEQIADSNATIKEEGFRPAFCIGDGGFDDLPDYEMYQNNEISIDELKMLSDQNTDFTLVSVNSPFGKAVISKKEKDEFSYVTPGKIVVSGVIDEIISEKEVEEEPKQKIKK